MGISVGGRKTISKLIFNIDEERNFYGLSKKNFKESFYETDGEYIDSWLKDKNKSYFKKMDFYPRPRICPEKHYNTFEGFDFEERYKPNDAEKAKRDTTHYDLFKELIDSLCDYDKTCSDYLEKLIAHIIQCPGTLPKVAVVILGIQGVGKSKLLEVISRLIGALYCFVTNDPSHFSNGSLC